MWPFGKVENSVEDGSDEHELLREEAEELQLKLDALRMADYRQAQRVACGKEAPPAESDDFHEGVSTACSSRAAAAAAGSQPEPPAQFYLEDGTPGCPDYHGDDLNAMYNFSEFEAHLSQYHDDDVVAVHLEQLRIVERRLSEREQVLEDQLAAQNRKMSAASASLERTRANLRQLKEQMAIRQKSEGQSITHADALQVLLAEKERRLMTALIEASSALDGEDLPTEQELPEVPAKEDAEMKLLYLAATTEELTDALEMVQNSEEDARRQLKSVAIRMQQAQEQRLAHEHEVKTLREGEDVEIVALRAHLKMQEHRLVWERARAKEIEYGDVIKKGDIVFPDIEA